MVGIGYRSLIIATDAAWAVCFGSSTQLWSHSLKLSIKSLISITALVLVLTVSVSADENDILAGAAECEITPPKGIEIHTARPNVGARDPLFLRALLLQDPTGTSVAIITADIICSGFAAMDELRDRVKNKTDVDEVLFNCSHAHSSRWLRATPLADDRWTDEMIWDEFYQHPLRDDPKEAAWNQKVHQAAVEVVADAKKRLQPATLHAGRAPVQIGFNRRITDAKGWTTMGVNRDRPAVPWVNVLAARDRQTKKPFAVLFEHPAHPVTVPPGNNLVSADFPGSAVTRIREQLGDDVIAMYGQGCCGNINSFPLRTSFADADAAGKKLGDAVLSAMKESTPIDAQKITLRSRQIELATRPLPTPELIAKWKQENINHPARIKQLNKMASAVEHGKSPPPRRFDVYGVMLCDQWCLVGMSYETFAEYELWIDQHAPFTHKMVFALTNGGRAYIGTDAALAMGPRGGYEAACLPNWVGHETMSPHLGPPAVGTEKKIHRVLESLWAQPTSANDRTAR
tara:strand:+ start:277 stop:1821 length:1545 start_codon:yes stop_codon:yes gene_type:complete